MAQYSNFRDSGVQGAMVVALSLILLGMMFSLRAGCSGDRESVDPYTLAGKWVTEDPKYEDRFFDIRKHSIAFGTGGNDSQSYEIIAMVRNSSEGLPEYIIHYKDPAGERYEMSFYFDPKAQVIRLKHQEKIEWKISN